MMDGTPVAVAPRIARVVVHVSNVDRSRTWHRLTLSSAVCLTLLDAALLQRKHALFTGGFLSSHEFRTIVDSATFLLASLVINAAVVAPLVLLALTLARRLHLRPLASKFAALATAVLPFAVANFVGYKIWDYMGDAFDFHVMVSLTGHRLSEVFAVAAPLMSRPLGGLMLGVVAMAAVTWLLHRVDRRSSQAIMLPTVGATAYRCLTLGVAASALVTTSAITSETMAFAQRWTPAGQLFSVVLNRISDVDRDGYGVLRNPIDTAPWDPSIHPYAIDAPGNGIDENGLAGDLPTGADVPPSAGPITRWPERPTVILFVLESLRADVVGTWHNGRRVTPVMDLLAAEGVSVNNAWSHAGSTAHSRYHLLTGSVNGGRGASTILDDFKQQGYEVGYFSGQDDAFGDMGIDYSRVDKFYDARQDVAKRYSTSTTPGSLAVPLQVVEERISQYLSNRTQNRPLFLYVNFHDTHYPYNHAGLDNLLDVQLLPASLISPNHRQELVLTYLNAVANVDRAIGRVVQAVEQRVHHKPAVVIVGDHGESLFERGVLGHGFELTEAQTRVPLIVTGLPVTVKSPFGLTELRPTIVEALKRPNHALARGILQRRDSSVFQYVGTFETPSQIGWRTADGLLSYDFRSERVGIWNEEVRRQELIGHPKRLFDQLVHSWERMLLNQKQRASTP